MGEFLELKDKLLVLYDGECGFCNLSIRWLLRRDRQDRLRFTPSTSPSVQELLSRHGFQFPGEEQGPGTILVFRNLGTPVEELLVRSNAFLACLRVLPQPWPAFAIGLRVFPRPFREICYRFIARHRYRIWGRYASCPVPTAQERVHFL